MKQSVVAGIIFIVFGLVIRCYDNRNRKIDSSSMG